MHHLKQATARMIARIACRIAIAYRSPMIMAALKALTTGAADTAKGLLTSAKPMLGLVIPLDFRIVKWACIASIVLRVHMIMHKNFAIGTASGHRQIDGVGGRSVRARITFESRTDFDHVFAFTASVATSLPKSITRTRTLSTVVVAVFV